MLRTFLEKEKHSSLIDQIMLLSVMALLLGPTLNAPIVVAAGGQIVPGGSTIQTYMAGLDFSQGGTYDWKLATSLKDNPTGTAGTDFDQIQEVGGNLSLGGSSSLSVDLSLLSGAQLPGKLSTEPFWNSSHIWTIATVSGAGTNAGATNFTTVVGANALAGDFATHLNPDGKSIDLVFNEMNRFPAPGRNTSLGTVTLDGPEGSSSPAILSVGGVTQGTVHLAGSYDEANEYSLLVQFDVKGTAAAIDQWYAELSGVQTGLSAAAYTIVPAGTAYGPVPTGDSGFVLDFARLRSEGDSFINFDWTAGNPGVTLDEIEVSAPEPSSSLLIALTAPLLLFRRKRV